MDNFKHAHKVHYKQTSLERNAEGCTQNESRKKGRFQEATVNKEIGKYLSILSGAKISVTYNQEKEQSGKLHAGDDKRDVYYTFNMISSKLRETVKGINTEFKSTKRKAKK